MPMNLRTVWDVETGILIDLAKIMCGVYYYAVYDYTNTQNNIAARLSSLIKMIL